jgi:protein involved in polysaccharide export with SLBB domain
MVQRILAFAPLLLSSAGWAGLGQENYMLGLEDEIEIRVGSHDDLTRKTRVGLEGMISFPFVEEVKAGGLTL